MTPIALVVSDVDGTLLTKDKTLTDGAKAAVRRLHEAGIGFTITSSRPTIGMRFLIEPLAITLPVGAFNGSCIVDPQLNVIDLRKTLRVAASCTPESCAELRCFGTSEPALFSYGLIALLRKNAARFSPPARRAARSAPSPRSPRG